MASQNVIGIDLGTTNTCAAVYRDGHSQIIYNEQGNHITPSCVAFSRTGRVVGEGADFRDIGNIANIVTDIKRMMGHNFNDPHLQRIRLHWPFRVTNVNNKPSVEVSLYGRKVRFAPEELSAMILSKVKQNA
ncbi:hypothetical protein DSO57_1006369 [Entomophthora muscae]|uniref:Uncharacterized protein n=1 Tax=Entomophthora muscae TaxID=34485 RepID=A0ACC2SWJ3_9FUNG|nr:hypothetical protein DSO57_1006369 [Entomophthora muscae]